MFRNISLSLVVALSLMTFRPYSALSRVPSQAARQNIHRHEKAVPNSYIVVLKDEVAAGRVRALAEQFSHAHGGRLVATYRHALKGFSVQLNARAAEALSRDPQVEYVEEDAPVELASTQTSAPWGLDRTDQRDLPLSTTYTYANSGAGAHVYIIDSGIRTTHEEFGTRASVAFDNVGDNGNGEDCFGHGTHVASVVGGETYGVAKAAQLHSVRIFNCSNGGSSITKLVEAIDFITGEHQSPAVAVLSVSTTGSTSLDTAVGNSIAAGITYVVAAGNGPLDASNRSPARVTEAITVGATDDTDTRASFSNYGSALDLFAPGVNIPGANWDSDTSITTRDGTSLAAAHAAGVAARYLSGNPNETPEQVSQAITGNASAGKVSDEGTDSPNLLLYRPNSKIAFTTYREQKDGIFVMNADGSGTVRLSFGNDGGPDWSADGTKLAFSSTRDGNTEVYVMNADGTGQTNLTNNSATDYGPAWSPDGTKIAFTSLRNGNREVYAMNADGTGQTNLTSNSAYDADPAWSPDGTKIAFRSLRDGNSEIYVMNADGSSQTRLTSNTAFDQSPAWSPDGTKIAFVSNLVNTDDIYVMNANGSSQTNLTNSYHQDLKPDWSPDGTKIAFHSNQSGDFDVHTLNVSGGGQSNLTNNTIADSGASWSPDGTKIAFASDRDSLRYEVFLTNPDGSSQTNFTNSGQVELDPAWSSDGRRMAFTRNYNDVYAMDVDGTNLLQLTTDQFNDYKSSWSPDNSQITFVSDRGGQGSEIWKMNADGSSQTNLTNNSVADYDPVWSPDGTKILFVSQRDGNDELYVMNIDGTSPTRLTNNSAQDISPHWSPDGSKVAFTSTRDGNQEIYVMNADGTNVVRLTNSSAWDSGATWSPDGEKIAFVSMNSTTGACTIVVMNADGSNQASVVSQAVLFAKPAWQPL
jgi:Tol biopolymer transport system component